MRETNPTTEDQRGERKASPRTTAGVLVIAPTRDLTFVEDDIRALSHDYEVDVITRRDYSARRRLIPELLRRFSSGRYRLVYIWFAEPHDSPYTVLLARLFGVKSAVVAGGYDVASMPEIGYGALLTRGGRLAVKSTLFGAHTVLPTSRFVANEVRRLGRSWGLRVIYPGVDCHRFSPDGAREHLVVTVGTVGSKTWRLKGLDLFAECSRHFPEARFAVVGPCADRETEAALLAAGGKNFVLVGRRLGTDELLGWYRRASVYAQLSVRESFGRALVEAMSCGCAPVVARTGALPEVVGDAGFVTENRTPAAVARVIARAMESKVGSLARKRVTELYCIQRRDRELRGEISSLLGVA